MLNRDCTNINQNCYNHLCYKYLYVTTLLVCNIVSLSQIWQHCVHLTRLDKFRCLKISNFMRNGIRCILHLLHFCEVKQFLAEYIKVIGLKVCGTVPARSPTRSTQSRAYAYCLSRKNDYENFLCTLLLPRSIKSAAFAVRAFNVEVAQVEDQVTDSKIGAMRLQFWTNALNEIYNDNPPKSPVALELHRVDE